MKNKYFYLYKITNSVNNKIYIGQSKNPSSRWSRHKSNAKLGNSKLHLYESMRKYSIEKFTFEVIAQSKTQEDIDEAEIVCIKQYNACDHNYGYNNSLGGQGYRIMSEETKKKFSEIHKGNKYRLGKSHSEETKKILSNANKGNKYRLGFKCSIETKKKLSEKNIGKIITEETKNKMSQSMIGKNSGNNNGMYGKYSPNRKLTQEDAFEIRIMYNTNNFSLLELAIKYNVSKKTILDIIHLRKYKG